MFGAPMKRPTLTTWILVGLVAGVVCGLAAHYGLPAEFNDAAVRWALKPMGDLFLRAITMMVVPVAFSTSSSNATLPVNMEVTEKRNGVSKSMAGFVLPLGATINMDGTAIMQGVATAFIAQVYGIHLTLGDLVTVVLTATLASIGTAGVPGVGLVTLSMVLVSVNLPVEGIALVIGVDRILDMLRTVVNITGDAVTAVVVAKSENEWDRAVFEQQNPEERQHRQGD